MKISAIVVNYNSGPFLRDCLEGLLHNLEVENGTDEIVVVDNQSSDGSLALVESVPNIRIIRSHSNGGYGAGCNIGSEHTTGDILVFMNPDSLLASSGRSIKEAFNRDANCALVAPCIITQGRTYNTIRPFPTVLSDTLGEIGVKQHGSSRRWHSRISNIQPEPVYFTGFPSGCAIFVRREVFNRIDKFDARFFLYYEEADLCKRLADIGYRFIYEPKCIVRHDLAGSSSSLGWSKTAIRYNSKLRYFSKHLSKNRLRAHKTATLIVLFLKFLLYLLGIRFGSNAPDKYRAYLYGIQLYISGYTPWNS